jgi:hypothetical protein
MTAYCATMGPFWGVTSRNEVGLSDAAGLMHKRVWESVQHLNPQMEQLIPEIKDVQAASSTAVVPVDQLTADVAVEFAWQLPRFAPSPEISPDPDGEISFDWFGSSGKMFSVSVSKTGRLSYAGLFGESRVHGTEKLAESIPKEVLRGLLRATL